VFESQHSVDDWLHSIKEESKGGNNHFHAEISGKRRSMLWFHLACPTRISQPKIGICEAGSFDNLEDEVYKKTVKPAESSFGVVSYDAKTDSTVLVSSDQCLSICCIQLLACCYSNILEMLRSLRSVALTRDVHTSFVSIYNI
jgi:hypothetical protein